MSEHHHPHHHKPPESEGDTVRIRGGLKALLHKCIHDPIAFRAVVLCFFAVLTGRPAVQSAIGSIWPQPAESEPALSLAQDVKEIKATQWKQGKDIQEIRSAVDMLTGRFDQHIQEREGHHAGLTNEPEAFNTRVDLHLAQP